MLWDYLKTLIIRRLTMQRLCMCAGCQRGRRTSQSFRQGSDGIASLH
jgi:hypothetical protein